ncbi:MAG: hypothetical protein EA361_03660 [Bacteroidetes bacterium]|nr:MAG: hypothetical protein EA361_03660 [Bacteroidota bacterium]
MKLLLCMGLLMAGLLFVPPNASAQQQPLTEEPDTTVYVVRKNDGTRYVGKILYQDAREVLMETLEIGQVYIPRHEIREIRQALPGEILTDGAFKAADVFSTRYFITTNGLPVKKGDSYILWNLYGPDFQFGISDNLGVGILTSWIGIPVIGSIKYSIPINEKWNAGLGTLVGSGSWAMPSFAGILPYGVITWGDRVKNINLSLGYGGVTYKTEVYEYHGTGYKYNEKRENEGSFLISIAGMAKLNDKVSIVFDTFIIPRSGSYTTTEYYDYYDYNTDQWVSRYESVTRKKYNIALILPGLRFQTRPDSAFQFGFAGIRAEGETTGFPLPMVQWFRKL